MVMVNDLKYLSFNSISCYRSIIASITHSSLCYVARNLGRTKPRTPRSTKYHSVPDPSQKQVLIQCQIPSKIMKKQKRQKPLTKGS